MPSRSSGCFGQVRAWLRGGQISVFFHPDFGWHRLRVTISLETFSTPSTKSSYVFPPYWLSNLEVETDLGSTDQRLVRDRSSSGGQEVFEKLIQARLLIRMDQNSGGLQCSKLWTFTETVRNLFHYLRSDANSSLRLLVKF